MGTNLNQKNSNHLTMWERWAFLLGRLIIIFAMVYIPIIFYTWTWRHFAIPKMVSFQFLVLMLGACWVILATKKRLVKNAIATPISMLAMMLMVSVLFAVNLAESWEQVLFYLSCLVFALLIPKFFTRLKDFEAITFLMGILCIFVDVYALAQRFNWMGFFEYSSRIGIEKFDTMKPVSFMGNENYTAEFLNIGVPLCFFMILCHWRRPSQMVFFTFVTLLNVVTLYYIDCNATYVGFVGAAIVALILFIRYQVIPFIVRLQFLQYTEKTLVRYARHALVLGVLVVSIGATLIAVLPNKVRDKMTTMVTWMDVDGDHYPDGIPPIIFRLQCMDAAIRTIRDVPLFGIGAGNFKVIHPLYENQLERKVLGEETLARKVHNDHLYHAVEHGVFGLFAWYWVVAATAFVGFLSVRIIHRISHRQQDRGDDSPLDSYSREFFFYLQLGLLSGIVTSIISCAFGHTFVIPSSAVSYWLATGLTVAAFQVINRAEKRCEQPNYGTISTPLLSPQRITSLIPGAVRMAAVFLIILFFGVFNLLQFMGETYMKYGMSMKDRQMPLYNEMFHHFEDARAIYPYQMELFYILGRYYIDAVMDIDNASRSPQGSAYLNQVGLEPQNRMKYIEEGIVTLQTDIYMNPNYKWAHNNLGVLYDRLSGTLKGDYHSKAAYGRVLNIDNEQIYAHYNLGLGAWNKGDYETAIERLEMALVVDPGKTEIYRYLANCFAAVNDFESAIIAADKYLGYSIRDAIKQTVTAQNVPLNNYSDTLDSLEKGNIAQGLTQAQRKIDFKNDDLRRLYLYIANSLTLDKDKNQQMAYETLQKAEQVYPILEPGQHQELLKYGQIYYACGYPEKTAEKYEEYLRIEPNDLEIRTRLTNLYTNMQEYSKALRTFSKVYEMRPNEWTNNVSMANLLAANQANWNEIYRYIQRAVQLGGDDARKFIATEGPANMLDKFIAKDERLQKLVGPKFWKPSDDAQKATQSIQPSTQRVNPASD